MGLTLHHQRSAGYGGARFQSDCRTSRLSIASRISMTDKPTTSKVAIRLPSAYQDSLKMPTEAHTEGPALALIDPLQPLSNRCAGVAM